ncbi:MAG: serine hydrolase [Bacteroidia bacterium]|nr:serine hydrolase [Bacteroidia bacterium]
MAQTINWKKQNDWVDSVYGTLNTDQKIAQLMIIAAFSNKDKVHVQDIECHVRELGVGGLIFFKGTPYKQAVLTNQYQKLSKIPLFISIDGEWGLNMRLDSTPVFPRQMVFGGANRTDLTKQFGVIVGKQCKRIGINFNFAPDIDVNNNMNNPVINDRSYGESKYIVAKNGIAYMQGMQSANIIASAKHFPGHGDTETDSHFGLPIIKGNLKRLDSLELYPFHQLIDNGLTAIMSAHLSVPALDSTENLASSISPKIVTDLLQKHMGFEGLITTDALNMKGVSNYYEPGELAAKALAAGNNILLMVEDVPMSIAVIKDYMNRGLIPASQLEESCKKILIAKYWCGLNKYKPIILENLTNDLNSIENDLLIKQIVKNGVVVAKNLDKIIPILNPEQYKIACINVGSAQLSEFQLQLNNYIKADYYSIDKNDSRENFDSLLSKSDYYNLVIITIHSTSRYVSKNLGLTQAQIDFITAIGLKHKCILVNNGNPYILQYFNMYKNVVVAYEDLPLYNQIAAQIVGGGISAKGKMPVSVTSYFPLGSGTETEAINKFEYIYPEEIKINSSKLNKIDSIVNNAIALKAMPGCQVFVAKQGKVIYNKSFGFHTYDSIQPIKNNHIYDVASLTKILSTTLAIMKLYEEKKLKLDDKIGFYLPFLKGSNKEKIKISEILTHQTGLIPFIPFYKASLLPDGNLNPTIYSDSLNDDFSIKVADNIYINKNYEKVIWTTIAESDLKKTGEYVYSDLGFMMLRKIVEIITNQDFESYLQNSFYKPLNLSSMAFNPLKTINSDWIVPTEIDSVFRKQMIKGYVHDPGAAMLGGVSGHAGLFANANDVAIIMQMLLNKGFYGNNRVLKASTIETFTNKYSKKSRRGLGFDKPETDPLKDSPTSKMCSEKTFGHQGFTGTCTWVDPENELVYVFLSNRIYPTAENKKFGELSVRTKVQDAIYEALK